MFDQLQIHPAIAAIALVLSILCLVGSLYLTYVAHHIKSLTAHDQAEEHLITWAIRGLARTYGNTWYLLMGVTWFIPVFHRVVHRRAWWPSVYAHAEWTFRVAKWFYERENE